MKLILLVALLSSFPLLSHADILSNGNFADGTAHWEGDAHASDDPSSPGITIKLNPTQWTKISQIFNTHENALDFSLSYKTSSDCSFAPSTPTSDPKLPNKQFLTPSNVGDLTGTRTKGGIHVDNGTLLLVVVDRAAGFTTWFYVKPKLGSTDAQSLTGTFPKLEAHEEKTLVLCVPPGNGSITLLNIALTPTGGSAPTPAPAQ